MKLLYCPKCGDVRKLTFAETVCDCGESSGRYLADGVRAVVTGRALVIGIDNFCLRHFEQLRWRHPEETYTIPAWLMRDGAPNVERLP